MQYVTGRSKTLLLMYSQPQILRRFYLLHRCIAAKQSYLRHTSCSRKDYSLRLFRGALRGYCNQWLIRSCVIDNVYRTWLITEVLTNELYECFSLLERYKQAWSLHPPQLHVYDHLAKVRWFRRDSSYLISLIRFTFLYWGMVKLDSKTLTELLVTPWPHSDTVSGAGNLRCKAAGHTSDVWTMERANLCVAPLVSSHELPFLRRNLGEWTAELGVSKLRRRFLERLLSLPVQCSRISWQATLKATRSKRWKMESLSGVFRLNLAEFFVSHLTLKYINAAARPRPHLQASCQNGSTHSVLS